MAAQTSTPVFGRLLALHPDVQQPEYWLEVHAYRIGRDEKCDIVVKRDTVSGIHAQLDAIGSHFVLRDLLSRNGTYVDGNQIEGQHVLEHGQEIGLAGPEPLFIFESLSLTVPAPRPQPVPETLRYDEKLKTFYLNDQRLELTPLQFRLLDYLYQHKRQVCTREDLAGAVWPADLHGRAANDLDKLLFHLRKRLRQADPEAELIRLHRGFGYLLDI